MKGYNIRRRAALDGQRAVGDSSLRRSGTS